MRLNERVTFTETLAQRRWQLREAIITHIPERVWPREVTIDGAVIPVRDMPYRFGVKRLLVSQKYEVEERSLLLEVLQPGMQVLELGGSIGILAAVASHAVGTQGRVVTVEADANLAVHARSWLEGPSSNVTVVTGAAVPVWRTPDTLRVLGFDSNSSSLLGRVVLDFSGDGAAPDMWDVSRLCEQYNLEPDVLMVDIEGSEVAMAHAPLNFPASVKYLVIEVHPHKFPSPEADEQAVWQAIKDDGFVAVKQRWNSWLCERRA